MRWRPIVEEYLQENKEATPNRIKSWVRANKFEDIIQDRILWIEKICTDDPRLKKVWYEKYDGRSFRQKVESLANQFIRYCNAQIRLHLNNMVAEGKLIKIPTNVGLDKFKYMKEAKK